MERGDLRVKRQVARINREVTEAPLETKNAYRTLPLAEDTVSVLLEQKKKSGWQPVGIPVAQRRSHLPGQRTAHAPSRRRRLHIPRPIP